MIRPIAYILSLLCATLLGATACSSGGEESVPGPENPGSTGGKPKIVWTPEAPAKGDRIAFRIEPSAQVAQATWNFGDKTTSSEREPVHSYAEAGVYTVTAIVKGTDNSLDSYTARVAVNDSDVAIVLSNDYPARMEHVTASLNRIPGVASVEWRFGDGSEARRTTGAESPVTHQYAADGTYDVTASIAFADGSAKELSRRLQVAGESLSYACQHFDRSKMWIMAHRGNFKGGYDLAPNSLSAYRKCVELGCVELIETDVQITKDGVVICLHDDYLNRFTDYVNSSGTYGYVKDFTYEEIRKYRLKTTNGVVTSDYVPTLEEVLMELRGKIWFNIDKCSDSSIDPAGLEKVYDVVKRCGCLDRVQFYVGGSSSGSANAEWLSRQEVPGIIAPHANTANQLTAMLAHRPWYMIQTSTATLAGNLSWLSTVNARGISVSNLLDDYGSAFLSGNTAQMDLFVGAGLDVIQCDYPPEMDAYLKTKGKR
ncbi:MAG: PKD domain-containing protein [Alistipes sp.]|nr:PKD domain-containing protein [Alistipes sp.]